MLNKSITVLTLCLLATSAVTAQSANKMSLQLNSQNIKSVVKAMTLNEKAHLVVGNDQGFPRGYPSIFGGPDTLFGKVPAVVGNTKQLVQGSAGTTYPIPRLGIPAIVLADGPAGLRIDPKRNGSTQTFYATAFPIATLLASSWDVNLVKNVGLAMGNEVLEYGVDILLAPALNIHRNPLGGRNFEYYSEDPMLSGTMAAAMVNGIQLNGVGTSIKHFAANNNETNRMTINAVISPKALREIYLKSFQIALSRSQPWTVMSSYNKINGTYSNETSSLMTGILRKEWRFRGFVMTDWFAGRDQIKQIAAGNDMIMPGSAQIVTQIVEAVRSGKLKEELLDRDVAAILGIIVKTPRFKKYHFSNKPDLKSHASVARLAANEGIILLKNVSHTLPISKSIHKLAAFGNGTFQTFTGGTGSGDVNKAYSVNINNGLRLAGYMIDPDLSVMYEKFLSHARDTLTQPANFMARKPSISELEFDQDFIDQKAKESDIAILTISRSSGEFHDRTVSGDFELTGREIKLIKQLSRAFHAEKKRLVVVLNIGGVIEVNSWRNDVDAILLAWQPGQEAGNAVADLLSGRVNPSGKLPMSFPASYQDAPSANNFPAETSNPLSVRYEEGVYVGYRYYQAFKVKPAFDFGYGLSYTSFNYSNLKINSVSYTGKLTATITIKNTGAVAGKEVVQCYVEGPNFNAKNSFAALQGYLKTRLLKPGESQELTFVLTNDQLATFDTNKSAWVLNAGEYLVKIGASSADIKQQTKFKVLQAKKLKAISPALALKENLKEL